MGTKAKIQLSATLVLALASSAAWAGGDNSISVLHYWTSGGEAAAIGEIRKAFEAAGGTWIDQAVAGGGGDAHDQVLRSRTLAGDAPGAAIPKASDAKEWAKAGYIADLSDVAKAQNWDGMIFASVQPTLKVDGKYIAVPLFVHRFDSMYANAAILKKYGIEMPKTWDEFNAAATKLKAAGVTPLAHGGQDWQDAIVFENTALGVGGADFFKKAFVDLDEFYPARRHDGQSVRSVPSAPRRRRRQLFGP